MTGIFHLGWQRIETYLPEAGIRRNLLGVFIAGIVTSSPREENREHATTLALKSRLQEDSLYIQWIKKEGDLSDLKSEGYKNLLENQQQDLLNKMGAVVCFYITKDLSVHTSISRLLAGSEKISKIAQPVLDKMAVFASLSFLQSTTLIVLTPILLKLAHLALIKIDPQSKIDFYSRLKTVTNQASHLLEFLIYLRLSLVCLGISQSLGGFFGSTFFEQMFRYLLSDQNIQRFLLILQPFLKGTVFKIDDNPETVESLFPLRDLVVHLQPSLLKYLFVIDAMPKIGIEVGFCAMNAMFSRRTDSSDTNVLERLFQATAITQMNAKRINSLHLEIQKAQDTGSISKKHAHALIKRLKLIQSL